MAEVVKVACPHDCPDTCAMLVTVEDGVATEIYTRKIVGSVRCV